MRAPIKTRIKSRFQDEARRGRSLKKATEQSRRMCNKVEKYQNQFQIVCKSIAHIDIKR